MRVPSSSLLNLAQSSRFVDHLPLPRTLSSPAASWPSSPSPIHGSSGFPRVAIAPENDVIFALADITIGPLAFPPSSSNRVRHEPAAAAVYCRDLPTAPLVGPGRRLSAGRCPLCHRKNSDNGFNCRRGLKSNSWPPNRTSAGRSTCTSTSKAFGRTAALKISVS